MKTIRFTVPPTKDQGSHTGTCRASHSETYRQNALWDYNNARAHDGLPPVKRMPAGTAYHIPTTWYIQRREGRTVETVDQLDSLKEAQDMRKEYCIADPSARFTISRRACKGWND